MKNKYIFFLFISILFNTRALMAQQLQDSIPAELPHLRNHFKMIFSSNLGIQWEQKLNKVSSLGFFGGYSLGRQSDNYTNRALPIITSPDAYIEYRNYFDLLKRIANQRYTRNNSAEFFFGRVESVFAVSGQNTFNLLFIQGLGAQRSVTHYIQAGLQAGLVEHFFYDKPITGGFNYIRLEPMFSIVVSFSFQY
jgi:hypothetical protein